MHLVVDMQGAQTGSRYRGIGRLTLALVKAIVRQRGQHQVTLALSGLFPDSIKPLTEEFAGLLPEQRIHVWNGLGPTWAADANNNWRREVSERLREAAIASLRPDAVLITSLFEGYTDNAVHSIGLLSTTVPTAAIFYDLIPMKNPGPEFKDSLFQQAWYQRKVDTLKQCQHLLAISEYSRREALDGLGFDPRQVSTIGCGCDPSFRDLGLTPQDKAAVREAHGIRKPFVMYTGGGDISKNLGRLILAFSRLDAALRDRHALVLVGKFERHNVEKLQAIAGVSGMNPDDLRFPGYVSDLDLVRLYNACSVFAFPSLHEGFGLPPLEAMACGAPVIASNATSLPEVVALEEAMFDPLSIEAFTERLHLALSDANFRERLISHGKDQATRFTWDQSATRTWKSLSALRSASRGEVSALLSVDKTGIFGRRLLRILVTKLDHLGDFILSIPALAKLRAKYPDAQIDVVVGSWNVAFARELGFFRTVHSFDYFKRKSSSKPSAEDAELSGVLKALDHYDIAIDLRRQPDSRFLLVKTSADLKIGYQTFDQEVDARLDVMLQAYKEGAHIRTPLNVTPVTRQLLRLVDALPGNVNDFVALPAITPDILPDPGRVAIFPKAGTDAREWNTAHFCELVKKFLAAAEVSELHVCFVNESEAAEYTFPEDSKLHVQVGLDFSALTRLLAGSSLCVANNSGGIHLASYLGVPVLGIYSGHELAAEWGPQFYNSVAIHRNADCAPCHLGRKSDCPYGNFCLEDISVEDVFRKSMETLVLGTTKILDAGPGLRNDVGLQLNSDAIVKTLIGSLAAHLDPANPQSWIDVSTVIARNHPTYSMLRESDLAYANIVNVELDHRSKVIQWLGFSGAEPEFRWSDGASATMQFYLEDEGEVPANARLLLVFDTYGKQRIIAKFNSIQVYDAVKAGKRQMITLHVRNMRYGLNRLELQIPDATRPGTDDRRLLGVAVRRLKIAADDEARTGIARGTTRLKDWMIRWQ